MKSFFCLLFIALSLLGLSGCYQISSDEDTLRTVPVTNNPNLVPGGAEPTTLTDAMKAIATP